MLTPLALHEGRYGFLLPPDQIIPTGEETMAGVIAMALFIQSQPLT